MKTKELEAQYGLPSILQALYNVRRDQLKYWGICGNVVEQLNKTRRAAGLSQLTVRVTDVVIDHIQNLALTWEHHSGDLKYPVPYPVAVCPRFAYEDTTDYWDKSTEYGQLRYELLDYLIERVENGD